MVIPPRNPAQSSIKLTRIVVASPPPNEDLLQDRIVGRANGLGGDAVTLGKVDILEFMGSRTLYESTVNQAGTGHYSHIREVVGMVGSLSSGFLLCVQGAEDQRE